MSDPVLEIKNLSSTTASATTPVHALRDVTLTLHRGEVLGLAGESRLRQVDARLRARPGCCPRPA